MTKRTDVHAPSRINPGDYALTGNVFDLKYDDLETMDVGTKPYGHCNHCGKAIRWAVEFTHVPTRSTVVFGEICADILSLSNDRVKHELVLLKRRVKNLEQKIKFERERDENEAQFKARYPELHTFLETEAENDNQHFVQSLSWSYKKWGALSTAQAEALQKVLKQREERAAAKLLEPIPTAPVAEGRQELEGEVLNTKYQDSFYGTTLKMLVRLADANKVWGTVPANIDSVERGAKVKFVATVERSKDDEHFGYFKKPTKAEII